MSSKFTLSITSNGDRGSHVLPKYFGSLRSIQLNVFPSLLFCHSIPSSEGHDEMVGESFVLRPKYTNSVDEMWTFGKSTKQRVVKCLKGCFIFIKICYPVYD